jgi:hypothetical protein
VDGSLDGEVGLYFLRSQFTTATGTHHAFCELLFNDRHPDCRDPDGRPGSSVTLEVRRRSAPGGFQVRSVTDVNACLPLAGPWRAFKVEVEPEEVRVFCDDRFIGAISPAQLVSTFQSDLNKQSNLAIYDPRITPSFAPAGGLGLSIKDGWASFRNAVVEPLD